MRNPSDANVIRVYLPEKDLIEEIGKGLADEGVQGLIDIEGRVKTSTVIRYLVRREAARLGVGKDKPT